MCVHVRSLLGFVSRGVGHSHVYDSLTGTACTLSIELSPPMVGSDLVVSLVQLLGGRFGYGKLLFPKCRLGIECLGAPTIAFGSPAHRLTIRWSSGRQGHAKVLSR